MPEILKIVQQTKQKFLNMFELTVRDRTGDVHPYYVASRALSEDGLKLRTGKNTADGVIIYAVHKSDQDRVVLIRQYRYSIGGYIYELPAGLVDEGESYREAAVREMKEETGLCFHLKEYDESYSEPFFTTVGMTDESCRTVYGTAEGDPSNRFQEANEDIEVCLADRETAKRILKEERVSVMAGYLLMNFINSNDPFWFLGQEEV
ncbi:MAG: NUDIX hydrolase [Lachnospiraceae bacterium]